MAVNKKHLDILNDLRYIEIRKEEIEKHELSEYGYWSHLGAVRSIKLSIGEVEQILKNRLK